MKTTKSNYVKMFICLGTQPVIKTTRDGKRMANFFATNTTANDACPPHKQVNPPSTKWFRVISWGSVADTASLHLQKGKKVLLMGNITTQQFTTKKGELRTKEVVVATNLILLDSGKTRQITNAA